MKKQLAASSRTPSPTPETLPVEKQIFQLNSEILRLKQEVLRQAATISDQSAINAFLEAENDALTTALLTTRARSHELPEQRLPGGNGASGPDTPKKPSRPKSAWKGTPPSTGTLPRIPPDTRT